MSRKPIIAGNWKMNKNLKEVFAFMANIDGKLPSEDKVEVAVAAPAMYLVPLVHHRGKNPLKVSAENVYFENSGAFTGEISAQMLVELGVRYAIVGHSERRQYFGETNETVNLRTKAAIAAELTAIVCVGESLEQREQGITEELVRLQTKIALQGVSAEGMAKVIVAYEPVWAIGTGRTATAEQAEEVCAAIRKVLAELYGRAEADSVTIQYGGSMNAANAAELLSKPNVDGGLIGGASLKPDDFAAIIKAASV
jgi:triosephosphate isomerase